MRLVSYNILNGGMGRVAALVSVIGAQSPDVIGLVEADEPGLVEDLAGRLDMDFIHAPGNTKASALLSRHPIRTTINHAALNRELTKSFLEAVVVDGAGVEWTIGVLHLHARATDEDETIREREIAQVLKILEPHRSAGRAHVLMGDFNANAPYQQIDPLLCKLSTRDAWEKNGGRLPRRVIQRVLNAAYADSLRVTDPKAAATDGTFSTEYPGQRVDYIFTFHIDPGRLKRCWIHYDGDAPEASDHFPVGAEIV